MGPLFPRRLAVGIIAGVCALALGLPATSRAQDPVEKLRQALKNPPPSSKDARLNAERSKRIQAALGELKTIAQRRRAFFLTEWSQYANLLFGDNTIRNEMEGYRTQIGNGLRNAIVQAAQDQDSDNLLAVAILIAELAETEQAAEAKAMKGAFVRGLTDVVARLGGGHWLRRATGIRAGFDQNGERCGFCDAVHWSRDARCAAHSRNVSKAPADSSGLEYGLRLSCRCGRTSRLCDGSAALQCGDSL